MNVGSSPYLVTSNSEDLIRNDNRINRKIRNSFHNGENAKRSLFNIKEISSHLKKLNYPGNLELIEKCGSSSLNFITKTCGCGTFIHQIKHSCNKRFCPICASKIKQRIKKRLIPYLNLYGNGHFYQFRFLSISPQNFEFKNPQNPSIDEIKQSIKFLKKSFNKFIRRKYVKDRIQGGFYVIEVKETWPGKKQYDKKGNYIYTCEKFSWNVHLHAIIYSRHLDNRLRAYCPHCKQNYLKYDRESKKYFCGNRKCNKEYLGIIPNSKIVNEFSNSSSLTCTIDLSKITKKSSVINYCLKYLESGKEEFYNLEHEAKYICATYNQRMINPFGKFYDFKLGVKIIDSGCRCRKCGEIITYSHFDLTISEIIRESLEDPPDNYEYGVGLEGPLEWQSR